MNPGAFSVRNRALVNAVFILVLVVGFNSLLTIPRELNPEVSFNWAFVTVPFVGATPEEVEDLVAIPIEDEVRQVDDVDVILSRSRASSGFVWVKFKQISQRDFERRVDDIRARVFALDLPEATEDPIFDEFSTYDFQPVMSVVVHGPASEHTLHDVARHLEEDLRDIDGVGEVERFGDRDPAVLVECDPYSLSANRLDVVDVEHALRLASINLPGGVLKLGTEEYLLRTRAQFGDAADVATVAVRAGPDGRRVLVGDVATVTDGFDERTLSARFNGAPSINLTITKDRTGNTLEIVGQARAVLEEWRSRLPAGVELDIVNDESQLIDLILGILQSNALLGLVLVVVALVLIIGWRSAVVAALGIPVTFLLAIIALDWTGFTLNGNTLFGLILVLGMVVDDAIVILENSYRHLQSGMSLTQAAIDGVREVVAPVTVSSLTTMAGFLPLVLMTGIMGKFMRIIPITVSLVLFASLVEALFVLPSHFVDIVRPQPPHARGESRIQHWQDRYARLLDRFLRLRYVVLPLALIMLAASVFLIPLVGVDLFAGDELSTIKILITMPDGTRLEETDAVALRFEAAARQLPADEVQGVLTDVGLLQRQDEWTLSSHVAQVSVDLPEAPDRERSLDAIIADLRRLTREIAGPVEVEIRKLEQGPPADAPVEVMLKGPDLEILGDVADQLKAELQTQPGVFNVRDDLNLRQPALDVVIDREAAARHGLDPTRIARSVRAAFAGTTATSYRRADEEVEVIVRFPEAFRTRPEDISHMRFVNPAGDTIPFTAIARLEERSGPLLVRRHDRERAVSVMADVDLEVTDIGTVNVEIEAAFDRLRSLYPGVRMEPGGQFAEFWEAFEDLSKLFALGLLLNFMLMAGQFKSWTQPLVIMAVVPLSFIGAMLGLLMSGDPFSIATLYGFVALAGVAVNDSIVLIDFVNQKRRAGADRWQSIREAGRLRLRPILLTSITTIFGLLPMAIGLGGSSKTWQPLAITIAAGLAVATIICLLVIPCLQAVVDDVAARFRSRVAAREL